jgi:DNA-binding LacI/PurR family transcriptional regulator
MANTSPITIKDVARNAQVSIATVSNVFNNHPNVNPETRQRVLGVASQLGYTGSNAQTNRQRERSVREVGFLLYDVNLGHRSATANPFWTSILAGVETQARTNNVKITYKALLDQEPEVVLAAIQEMRLNAILMVGPVEAELVQALQAAHFPVVLVDNYIAGLAADAVMCDNYEGAKTAVGHLLAAGHEQIAFIGGPTRQGKRPINTVYTIEQRALGYRTALLDAGIAIDYDLYEAGNLDVESGYKACKRLLVRGAKFTGLFCANDSTAVGALKALRETGLSAPQDVSIVGFDDIELAEHVTPALTTVHVPTREMGALALQKLIIRLNHPNAPTVTSNIAVRLIVRESVSTRS